MIKLPGDKSFSRFTEKIVELSRQVELLCNEIDTMKSSSTEDQAQLSNLLDMKVSLWSVLH